MSNKLVILLAVIVLAGALSYIFKDQLIQWWFRPTRDSITEGLSITSYLKGSQDLPEMADSEPNTNQPNAQTADTAKAEPISEPIQVVARDLTIPWEIAFLPDNSLLVTERPGTLTRIYPTTKKSIPISGVTHVGEGGLQGLALDPNFDQNQYLYLYLTTQADDGLLNRVERYRLNLTSNQLTDRTTIIDDIPGARFHDGGRIAFGPDGLLYIGTGDAGEPSAAQDTSSLAGKILRITATGDTPADNPFKNPVYSYGHRNVQGLAWDANNQLWATEHGPSGAQTGNDEVNLIRAGENYGWPEIKGTQTKSGMNTPIIESGTEQTWAPAGLAIVDDQLFFTGLRGVSLYQAEINNSRLQNLKANFKDEFGRLRVVKQGPDGWLYIATSNQDGRGQAQAGDDKIIRVHLSLFK